MEARSTRWCTATEASKGHRCHGAPPTPFRPALPQDEFMVVTDPKYNNSISAVLREFEHDAGSVLVHW